jgi:nitroreductase
VSPSLYSVLNKDDKVYTTSIKPKLSIQDNNIKLLFQLGSMKTIELEAASNTKLIEPEGNNNKLRNSSYKINPYILNRWSPRSFMEEGLTDQDLMAIFETARWAPSSYNNQPWRFIHAKRDTTDWNRLFSLLEEFNKTWAKKAAALVVIISYKYFEYNGKFSITHQFDTGAAWDNLAIEASTRGIATHAMEGFDHEKARVDLRIPDDYEVLATIAIGLQRPRESLPTKLRDIEYPSDRKPLDEVVMEGMFKHSERKLKR